MATIWAKNNGNWTDTTLWAFWNENTQQIEDYGQVPQSGDVVYCNGYEISFTGNLNIGGGTIHNDTNPYTMIGAGRLVVPNNNTNQNITANFKGSNLSEILHINRSSNQKTVNITGNIEDCNIYIWGWNGTLNGNVKDSQLQTQGYQQNVGTANINLTINGNIDESINTTAIVNSTQANYYTYIHINGNIIINNGYLLDAASTTIRLYLNGSLTNNYNGVLCTRNLNILALYGRYVSRYSKNITSGNITTFYISQNTQFQMTDENNTPFTMSAYPALPDYPVESNVKKDVSYAFNQMVGTYDINQYLPPESVVLKDYVYDSGNKTGKLVVLPAELISRLLNCPTIETMQQLLIAHLNPETD